jgi:hypothetical protein
MNEHARNKQSLNQQFNLRVLLVIGLLWGGALLVQLLVYLMTGASQPPSLASRAFVVNCLTVGPACLLAFWFRRTACAWMLLDAILAATAALHAAPGAPTYGPVLIVTPIVPILLAAALVFIELRRWPAALTRTRN